MLGGVERIVERPAALRTRLNGHAQSQRIVGDGHAPGPFNWEFSASDLTALLRRISAHDQADHTRQQADLTQAA